MYKIDVLIPAAGKGTRSGLDYPKTLFKVKDKEILLYIFELIEKINTKPTIIVSPEGEKYINNFLSFHKKKAELILQKKAKGMGNAVLQYEKSSNYKNSNHILLIWGDIPFIRKDTVSRMIKNHFDNNNDFTLVTKFVDKAYTILKRDNANKITKIIETREEGLSPFPGERDIGLFLFKKEPIFKILKEDLNYKFGKSTGEHGFLYIVEYLTQKGLKVEGLPIAHDNELKSLNKISDLGI
tara:strand:- start:244 stop:963 length:720 start_codon:yes stop_codon:yes gene_type:complete